MSSDLSYRPIKPLLPAEVGTVLSSWWLAVAAGLTGLTCLWPMILDGLRTKMNMNLSTTVGWGGLFIIVAGIVALGAVVSRRAADGQASGLRQMKLILIVGMIAGVAVMGLAFWLGSGSSPTPAGGKREMDLATLFSIMLLGMMGLVPYVFGILCLSLSGSDAVTNYFTQAEQSRTAAANQPTVTYDFSAPPAPEEAMTVDAPAEPHAADLEAILEQEASDATSSVQVTLDEPEKPSTQLRKPKDTQLRPEE